MFRVFFFQAEDGIRDLVRSRGLGDVYKRQALDGGDDVGDQVAATLILVDDFRPGRLDLFVQALSLIHI